MDSLVFSRRRFVAMGAATLTGCSLPAGLAWAHAAADFPKNVVAGIPALEKSSGGRLGVAVLDTATGAKANYRGNERFPMCSTFKLLAVSAVLAKVDSGKEHLDRLIRFTAKDVVAYSPVTGSHAGGPGMPLSEICAAAMTYSDNTAANLLLATIGGPAGLTSYARSLGDETTRLDRTEPEMNEAIPGDPRDTTSPVAMMNDVRSLMFGNALSDSSRKRLTEWLLANKTGDERLRADLPKGWRVGDKTGSGRNGSTNDVGILWPASGAPVIVSVYFTGSAAPEQQRNATIARVGKAVVVSMGNRTA